ncbi:DMT family transporter [Microseira wollei]|uniref:Conserved hypothetical membrane protein n=1 Tax=Microseira wollei NIES-4236 TaxID=2530354 RepID=A0AAV3XFP1_9CYAN|nr:DMT family transporter [Microseira wollei]GET41209.1 conserved hypothetical membrane protein [Microseira wollei NIES-4236]
MQIYFLRIAKSLLPFPYLTALLTAVFILSFAAILTRLSECDIGPSATIFNRYWIATVSLAFWQGVKAFTRDSSEQISSKVNYTLYDILLLFLEALLSMGCILLWAISLKQTSVANSNLLHNLTPIFSASFSFLIFGQRYDSRFLMGIIIAVCASIGIELEDWSESYNSFLGDTLALLSAVLYSISLLVREKLRTKFSPDIILLWSCTCRSILIFPIVLIFEDKIFPISQSGWLAVILLGICVQVFGHGLLIYSLKTFSSSFSALCLLLEPLITAFAAWAILAERLSLINWIAFMGVLIGVYLSSTSKSIEKS